MSSLGLSDPLLHPGNAVGRAFSGKQIRGFVQRMKQIKVDDQMSMFMCSGVQQKPRSGVIGPQKETIADETPH